MVAGLQDFGSRLPEVFSGLNRRVEAGQPDVAQQMLVEFGDIPWRMRWRRSHSRASATMPVPGGSAAGATIQPLRAAAADAWGELRSAMLMVPMSSPLVS